MTDIKHNSRRKFIKDAVKLGTLLPFAGQLLGQNAMAVGGYSNVLFMCAPNGIHPEHWNPKQGPGKITGTDELSFALGSLKDWHQNIIVLQNVYIDIEAGGGGDGGGHTKAALGCMTGDCHNESLASIDHLIAEKLTPPGVLSVGVRTGKASLKDGSGAVSKPRNVNNNSRPVPNNNPFDVATKLKSRVVSPPADPLQGKVYAAAIADMTAMAGDPLTGNRQSKIDEHQAALLKLKNKQQEGTDRFPFDFTTVETANIESTKLDPALFAQFPALCKSQINNIVAAFANDLHRVATLQIGVTDENSGRVNYGFDECWEMSLLAKERGAGNNLPARNANHDIGEHSSHGPSHDINSCSYHGQMRWHNSLLAYTLQQLKEKEILDKTLVVLFSEEGDNDHNLARGGIIVAGGTGGGLALGRVIDCGGSGGNGTHKLFGDIARLVGASVKEGPWKSGII